MTIYWAKAVTAISLVIAMVLIAIFAKSEAPVIVPTLIGLLGTALAFMKPAAESNAAIAKSASVPPPPVVIPSAPDTKPEGTP